MNVLLALVSLAMGSPSEGLPRAVPCEPTAAAGVAAFQDGRLLDARRALEAAVAEDPACAAPGEGLAGDWLGRTLVASGDTVSALAIWEATLGALSEATWARGGDALVGSYLMVLVSTGRGREARAAVAFDLLLRPTTTQPPPRERYWGLLAQVASVVPEPVRDLAFPGGDWRRGISTAGSLELAAWWLAQDPFPATAANERVEEHLLRVGVALTDYADPLRPAGYDDRGALFVRFGAPASARALTFSDPDLVFGMSRASVGVSRSSFPANEIWTYQGIDETMTYVLIGQDGAYHIGQTADLLPSVLRTVSGRGRRQQALAEVALLAMRYIYGELATTSMEYGDAWVEAGAALEQTASPFANPLSAVNRIQRQLFVREGERGRLRDERAPSSTSQVARQTPAVSYIGEVARFLDDDGRTRLDLTWRLREAPATSEPTPLVLIGTVVGDPGTSVQTVVTARQQPLSIGQVEGREHVSVSVASAVCERYPCAPSVQFDLFTATSEGLGARVGASVWRLQPQEPLRPTGLEISDLRPMEAARNEPYAREALPPGVPLSLYFEAYGFEGGAGRSRVHIEYEVVRRRSGSLLRRTREVPSSSDLRLFVRGTRTEQYVILDTADWDGADEVDVRVIVRDEQTGESVERSRTFLVE